MLNTLSPEVSVAQPAQCPFAAHELVMTHLPDPAQNNRMVPVVGVIVTPGVLTSEIRIRNKHGEFAAIVVLNSDLVSR